jgi:S-DNA-T family DNA segregation ATPase FtsK/SpoIIIE
MPESPLLAKEIAALTTLESSIAIRVKGESEVELAFLRRREKEDQEYRVASNSLRSKYQSDREALETEYRTLRQGLVERFGTELAAIEAEYAQVRQKIESQHKADRARARKSQEEARWQALAIYEAGQDAAAKAHQEDLENLDSARQDFEAIHQTAREVMRRCRRLANPPPRTAGNPSTSSSQLEPGNPSVITTLQECIARADAELLALEQLRLPVFLQIKNYVWPFVLLTPPLIVCFGLILGWGAGSAVALTLILATGLGGHYGLSKIARRRVSAHYHPLQEALDQAEALLGRTAEWVQAEAQRRQNEIESTRSNQVREADERMARKLLEADARHDRERRVADAKYPALLATAASRRDEELNKLDEEYPPRIRALDEAFERDLHRLQEAYQKQKQSTQALYDQAWGNLIFNWREGIDRVQSLVREVQAESHQRFLDWFATDLNGWTPPGTVPPGLKFGRFTVDLGDFPSGHPADPRLRITGPTQFELPALLPFPIQASVLIKTAEAGKTEAVRLLQALMLRFLTSVPPGKVRFTIFDPVGLGENFAAFMHLADYHELLVTSRIWTEAQHIEQRLADLSAHMENVIQKYLRNEFETIEEYNAYAGEVAEPFRVLVAANFPTNFNESAARRLTSIVSTGARCGVYALISLDTKLPLPPGCQLKDIEPHCVNFSWKEGRLSWRDPHFGRFPLELDAPPDPGTFSRLLHVVGEQARDANRVEVPFEFIAPAPNQYWSADSRSGVEVPLGRAGATKLQSLVLGKGTSQHVLIAGKTGSGKSTLLHALITNSALRYSPDELQLYLIDFKKGVEFKVYAAYELPHARVIAVESEREFGLSVLQRLDRELKHRGDLFREAGVQDLKAFRDSRPDTVVPRILLIVDEFQEFFVEDDKIAQEVSLLLDRLVRQGRAFGIHVVLGSQTLSGAYSLARSTLGQMAVRIALQCSEADAHLILSEDNTAARLLTRPGEAIYNDANGMVEGNNLFQVVWLSDERREGYLQEIRELARAQNRPPAAPIVFEGNLPADASKNEALGRLLEAAAWPAEQRFSRAWLGDAIAIKEPTCAVFRPQSGSNLLIVGQNETAALAMLMMSAISIAAQHAPRGLRGLRFYLLDGTPPDSSHHGELWKLESLLPQPVQEVTPRELGKVLGELAEEVARRRDQDSEELSPIYLMILDIQRFRDLRKSDDDFGFSSGFGDEKPTSPSKAFANILKDGPTVGVHTIVWCDSMNNLNRTFDRHAMREFEMRVLFQMSANDSSALIDSPAAGKLGPNRALYFSEDENVLEKFRPYGLPDPGWLKRVADRLRERAVSASRDSGGVVELSERAGHEGSSRVPSDPDGQGAPETRLGEPASEGL